MFSSHLVVVFALSIEVKNEDVIGVVLTDIDPTTSDWSTNLLPTKVQLILVFAIIRLPRAVKYTYHMVYVKWEQIISLLFTRITLIIQLYTYAIIYTHIQTVMGCQ